MVAPEWALLSGGQGMTSKTSQRVQFEATAAKAQGGPMEWVAALWRRRNWLLLALDAVIVFASFMTAYFARFHGEFPVPAVRPAGPPAAIYVKGALLLVLLWVFFLWREGAYGRGLRRLDTPMMGIPGVIVAGLYSLAIFMAISFMFRRLLLSRLVYLMTALLAGGTMILLRLLFRGVDHDLAAQAVVLERVMVVGMNDQVREFVKRLRVARQPARVVGIVREHDDDSGRTFFAGRRILGSLRQLAEIYADTPFETLVLAGPVGTALNHHNDAVISIVNFCEANNISLYMLPGSFDIAVAQREVASFSGMPVIRLQDAALHPVYAVVKRVMDFTIALVGLLVGLPLWLVCAWLIRRADGGPALYNQMRVGIHGRPFLMYKFRSMIVNADEQLKDLVDFDNMKEPVFNIRGGRDPRITTVGRFLRRTSLDEIPQLLNVLKGEMSVIGPRPERVELVERYTPVQRRRLKAKPGITGLQQVICRGDPSLSRRIKYDLAYLKQQSILLDLYILYRTAIVMTRGSGIMR